MRNDIDFNGIIEEVKKSQQDPNLLAQFIEITKKLSGQDFLYDHMLDCIYMLVQKYPVEALQLLLIEINLVRCLFETGAILGFEIGRLYGRSELIRECEDLTSPPPKK